MQRQQFETEIPAAALEKSWSTGQTPGQAGSLQNTLFVSIAFQAAPGLVTTTCFGEGPMVLEERDDAFGRHGRFP